jgi:hypothetical protein
LRIFATRQIMQQQAEAITLKFNIVGGDAQRLGLGW